MIDLILGLLASRRKFSLQKKKSMRLRELDQVTFKFIFVFAFDTRCLLSVFLTEIRLAEVVEDIFVGAHLVADFGLALLA